MLRRALLALALLGALVLLFLATSFYRQRDLVEEDAANPAVASASAPPKAGAPLPVLPADQRETGAPALAAITPIPRSNPAERSPLADTLHAPERNGIEDLAVVLGLFDYYLQAFGGVPSGENNAQIVNAFTGNNPRRIALLDRKHPAINPSGELTDRWGSPLFFHLIARDAIEIRSAGPDKILWSQDDLLTASPRLRAGASGP